MVGRSRPTALTSLSTEDVANGSRPKFNRQPGRGLNLGAPGWHQTDLTNCAYLAHKERKLDSKFSGGVRGHLLSLSDASYGPVNHCTIVKKLLFN